MLTLCYWARYYDFLYFWLADFFFHFWIIRIIYSRIIYGITIIYFYTLRQYRLTARASLFAVARNFLKIQSVRRHFFLCLRGGLWDFIEIISITRAGDKIPLIYQYRKLVKVCRARNTNSRPRRRRGQREIVIVCVRRKV